MILREKILKALEKSDCTLSLQKISEELKEKNPPNCQLPKNEDSEIFKILQQLIKENIVETKQCPLSAENPSSVSYKLK